MSNKKVKPDKTATAFSHKLNLLQIFPNREIYNVCDKVRILCLQLLVLLRFLSV
jgi:hypothetical protein